MSEIHQLCRLCLSNENLVDVFDERLANAYKLRLCVVLCTGIEIKMTDEVSKFICQSCCSLVIELYKFRQAAMANDKSLKNILNQHSDTISLCKETIQSLNESVLQKLAEDELLNFSLETEMKAKENENPKPILVDVATETDVIPNVNICETVETLKIRIPKHILTKNSESVSSSDNEIEEDNNRVSENEECLESDDDDTPIAALKRKYRSVRAHKMFESRLFSDSESDSEPISKRNKINKYYVDDDYKTDNETDNEEEEIQEFEEQNTTEWTRRSSRPQRRKTQMQEEADSIPDKSVEKQIVEQKCTNEPYSKYCEYCDRYFWGTSQLKAHQRVHFRCSFCTKGFESHEVLQDHLVNVCYSNIISQKLFIPLVRVDEDVELIRIYQSVFDKYFQDIANGVYGNPEVRNNPSAKRHLYRTEGISSVEKYEIHKMFIKFCHVDNSPVCKNLSIQTKRLQTDTSHPNLNNVVLDDAYKDLKLFNIPIQFVIDKMQSAYVSFAKPAKDTKIRDLWTATNVTDIVDKFKKKRNLSAKALCQNILQNNIGSTPMLPPPVPVNVGMRKPAYRVVSADGLQPKDRPNGPVHAFGNVHDGLRVGPNILRKPPPQKPSTGTVPNVPNLKIKYIAKHASNGPNINSNANTKTSSNETDSQKSSNPNPNPIILNVLLNEKSKNERKEQLNEAESNPRCFIRRTYNRKPPKPLETCNITKSVCENFKIHVLKQNPKETTSGQPESVTSEITNVNQNIPLQTNLDISYPPRPNTAIRNMLQNISSEISIEPNYRKQTQTTVNVLNTLNNEKTDSTPINSANNLSKPSPVSGKPKAYPRPILIKEEPPIGEEEYIVPDQPPLSNEDFSTGTQVKEEHEIEDHTYSQLGVTEDPVYTPNLYSTSVQPNMSYPEQHPVQYHGLPQQYYKPMGRATNLPGVRNRFPATTHPYRPVQYRGRTQMPMYHARINQSVSNIIQPPMSSNALVPANTFTNNFMPNNVYHRPFGNNYNNYNMYQGSYQNQYSSYNSQTQPTIDYNSPYQPDPNTQDTESKHLPVKQPWEMFR